MNPLDIAITAAKQAGKILVDSLGKLQSTEIKSKRLFDYVTTVDKESEQTIIDIIRSNFPDHFIFAEETGQSGEKSSYRWIIDPLDGTTNYIHGYPFCAISIALEYEEEIILGVIYDPLRNELFIAEKGRGAFLNGRKIEVSKEKEFPNCLIATGFPFKYRDLLELYLQTFSSVFKKVSGVRRAGSAALDLAYVACGRVDGFWEIKLGPWDVAAGDIIVREAGGKVTDILGGKNHITTGNVIATNGLIHEHIFSIVSRVFKENP
jgi:myo-inositol-1(or 4)-monophosphatase